MELKYEVKYVYDFLEHTHEEHHYIDGVEGRRYALPNNNLDTNSPYALPFEGTGDVFKVIKPILLGSFKIREKEDPEKEYVLTYLLPDINKIACVRFAVMKMGLNYFDEVWVFNENTIKDTLKGND